MKKMKMLAILAVVAMLAVCLCGCDDSSSSKSSKSDIAAKITYVTSSSSAQATPKASKNSTSTSNNTSTITTAENARGSWDLIRLDYTHKSGGETVLDGRYEGDGVVEVSKTGYSFVFCNPDGTVMLESSGSFTTGVQASYVGDSTISGYPVAMFGGFGSGIVMKFTDDNMNKTIVAMGSKRK